VMRSGNPVYALPALEAVRERVGQQLGMLHAGIKRFVNPHRYPAGLELSLHELKSGLVLQTRQAG
jgi:nicotinate phosphoribosyltransferase